MAGNLLGILCVSICLFLLWKDQLFSYRWVWDFLFGHNSVLYSEAILRKFVFKFTSTEGKVEILKVFVCQILNKNQYPNPTNKKIVEHSFNEWYYTLETISQFTAKHFLSFCCMCKMLWKVMLNDIIQYCQFYVIVTSQTLR